MNRHLVGALGAFLIFLFANVSGLQAQICTPDTTQDTIGLYPSVLPEGVVGEPYSATLQAVLPVDTVVANITFKFCKYRIVGTIPDTASMGLTYDCSEPGCEFVVDHSTEPTLYWGCAVIQGTPLIEFDTLIVQLEADIGSYNAMTNTCTVSSTLVLNDTVPFTVAAQVDGLAPLAPATIGWRVFPNPSAGNAEVRFELPKTTDIQLGVYDLTGRQVQAVFNGSANGFQRFSLNRAELGSGVYLVRLTLDNQAVLTDKWVVE
ncbi:MAG: T9SS type A sorting domain-containing protein [Bacteroidota bacterium]